MSTAHIQPQAIVHPWLKRVNAAIAAVQAMRRAAHGGQNNATLLTRQLQCLTQARAAWLCGDHLRADQLLTTALNAGDDEPPVAATPRANGHAAPHNGISRLPAEPSHATTESAVSHHLIS